VTGDAIARAEGDGADPAGPDAALRRGTTVPYRVRFDECGPDGRMRTSALLRYAQDIAWIHSELMGFDRAWYAERGLAWVVRAVELAVVAPISLGTSIDLSTEVAGFRKVWARRRSEARVGGELVAWAHTDWVITDTRRGMPGRVPAEIQAAFRATPGGFEPARVQLPPAPAGALALSLRARPQDLDPMGHVNNAAYVDYLEETLLAAGGGAATVPTAIGRSLRLEYLAPASPGSELRATAWPEPFDALPGYGWRLGDTAGRDLAHARVTAPSLTTP
jgi:acyl-ACP thioesterase